MPEDSLDRIIERAVKETIPRTIQLRVSIAQSMHRIVTKNGPSSLTLEQTYFETDRGERFFDESRLVSNEPVSHVSSYCDGKKCANVRFSKADPGSQDLVTINYNFMHESQFGFRDAPPPFRYYHVGLVPLHEALAKAERMGQERVIERTCHNFHFNHVGRPGTNQSLVYSLDEETSVPLKIAAYSDPEQLPDRVPSWVWEATTFDKVSDRHFARSSKCSYFWVTKNESGRWISEPELSQTIQVNEITFDAAIPHTAFWPSIQPGARVSDSISKRRYQTPDRASSTREPTGTPIRVAADSGSWLPTTGAVLSLAVLTVAAFLWRRSR